MYSTTNCGSFSMQPAKHMLHILIVDDDPDIQNVVSREVQQQGWVAIEAIDEAGKLLAGEIRGRVLVDISR